MALLWLVSPLPLPKSTRMAAIMRDSLAVLLSDSLAHGVCATNMLFHIGFVAVQAVVRRHFRASLEVRAGLDPGSTRDPWRSMNRDE